MAVAFPPRCAIQINNGRQNESFRCFTDLGRDRNVCRKYHFERLCVFASRSENQSGKKASCGEHALGLSEK